MLRARREFNASMLGGVNRSIHQTKLPFGERTSFRTLANVMPVQKQELWSLTRMHGASKVVNALAGTDRVAVLHVFRRVGQADKVLAVIHRTSLTDALYERSGSSWSLIGALPGTGKKYTLVQWRDKVFILDGANAPRIYNGSSITTLIGTNIPPAPQYGTVHQERLILDDGDKVWFSNVLDETTFLSTSFYNTGTGLSDQISWITVNSITTSTTGAQTQLAVFRTRSLVVVNGTISGGSETVITLSSKIGTPSGKTIAHTPYGTVFMGLHGVYLLDQSGREPVEIGVELGNEIESLTPTQQAYSVAAYHTGFYRLAIAGLGATNNTVEWVLNMHESVFPSMRLWYGPHNGDTIAEYLVIDNDLYGARANSTELWQLSIDGNAFSMLDVVNPRVLTIAWPTILNPGLQHWLIDAIGAFVTAEPGDVMTFNVVVDGAASDFMTPLAESEVLDWDLDFWDESVWSGVRDGILVVRPRQHGTSIAVTMTYDKPNNIQVHHLYLRVKDFRHHEKAE